MHIRTDLSISLNGYAAPAPGSGTQDNLLGEDSSRLIARYLATRTFQSTVLGSEGVSHVTVTRRALAERARGGAR
jgi:hypothetical protein